MHFEIARTSSHTALCVVILRYENRRGVRDLLSALSVNVQPLNAAEGVSPDKFRFGSHFYMAGVGVPERSPTRATLTGVQWYEDGG